MELAIHHFFINEFSQYTWIIDEAQFCPELNPKHLPHGDKS
jgi:hypothetical protein